MGQESALQTSDKILKASCTLNEPGSFLSGDVRFSDGLMSTFTALRVVAHDGITDGAQHEEKAFDWQRLVFNNESSIQTTLAHEAADVHNVHILLCQSQGENAAVKHFM